MSFEENIADLIGFPGRWLQGPVAGWVAHRVWAERAVVSVSGRQSRMMRLVFSHELLHHDDNLCAVYTTQILTA